MITWQRSVFEMRTRLTSTSCTDGVPPATTLREAESGVLSARWFCACWGGEPCCARTGAPMQNTAVRRTGRQRYLWIMVVLSVLHRWWRTERTTKIGRAHV